MKKKFFAISSVTVLTVGLLFGTLFVSADTPSSYKLLPVASSATESGYFLGYFYKSGRLCNAYFSSYSGDPIKLVLYSDQANYTTFVFASPVQNSVVNVSISNTFSSNLTISSFNATYNLYFTELKTFVPSPTFELPYVSNQNAALAACADGIWSDSPPVDPDFVFDQDLGYLMDVHYKQVYNEDTGLTTLDVSFSNITSTGVDLSQDNYGVAISYQGYENAVDDIPFWKSAIYRLVDLALGADIAFQILSHSNLYGQIQDMIGDFTGGGGGHSFAAPDNNEPIYLYDLILSPYYFDGTDEYFGYNTMISKVSVDSVGTRMISTGTITDGGQDDTETYMNSSQVITYYYDYGPESTYLDESTQYYYYITNNDFSTTAVTNNNGDTNTIINNIDNSTQNIYNFQGVGDIPDLDLSSFNIGLQDFIQMIKGVIVSLIIAFPMLSGLFDFLPVFAVSIAIAATQAVAVILIIRIFRGVGI